MKCQVAAGTGQTLASMPGIALLREHGDGKEFGDIVQLLRGTCPKADVPKLCQKTFHGQKLSTTAISHGDKDVPVVLHAGRGLAWPSWVMVTRTSNWITSLFSRIAHEEM